jgi:hypothetical protein
MNPGSLKKLLSVTDTRGTSKPVELGQLEPQDNLASGEGEHGKRRFSSLDLQAGPNSAA